MDIDGLAFLATMNPVAAIIELRRITMAQYDDLKEAIAAQKAANDLALSQAQAAVQQASDALTQAQAAAQA